MSNGNYVILEGPKKINLGKGPQRDLLITTQERERNFTSRGYKNLFHADKGSPLTLDTRTTVAYAATFRKQGASVSTEGVPRSLDDAIDNASKRYFLYEVDAGLAVAGTKQPGEGQCEEVGEIELGRSVLDNLQGCGRVLFFYDDVNESIQQGLNSILNTRYAVLETGNASFITTEEHAAEGFGEDYEDATVLSREDLVGYVQAHRGREFIATQKVSRGLVAELGEIAHVEVFDTSDQS